MLELIVQILQFQRFSVDPVDMTGTGSGINMTIGAEHQTEGVGFTDLAQIDGFTVIEAETIQMTTEHAKEEQGIVRRFVKRTIDGFMGHGNTEVFCLVGSGVINDDIAAGKTVPQVVIVGNGHPGGMTGRLVGGVGGHNHASIRHEADGGVEFTGANGAVQRQNHVFCLEMFLHLVGLVVIAAKANIACGCNFGGKTVIQLTVRAGIAVPNGIVRETGRIAVLLQTGLIDQAVISAAVEQIFFHVAHPPS